jgi:uncharacterized Zn finger protein (UPF0148 family)
MNDLQKRIEEAKKLLKNNGFTMSIEGCGCCGSPWVTLHHNGKIIIDDEEVIFNMFEDVKGGTE